MPKIKGVLFVVLFLILVYSRFVNISWGLPYPFHPDERNMANAIQSLNCEISNFKFQISNCYNPHFFAYGQFPLYLGYFGIQIDHLLTHKIKSPVSFEEAILSLRLISAVSSVVNVLVLIKIIELIIYKKNNKSANKLDSAIYILPLMLSPSFIQFSHFGTTESLLVLFYSGIIYLSLLYLKNQISNFKFQISNSFLCGLAVATKVSSIIFIVIPMFSFLFTHAKKKINLLANISNFLSLTLFFAIIFSPQNLISFEQFLGALRYESDVALGRYVVFYTRQFVATIPVLFQSIKIFPYALGWPVLLLGSLGFLGMSWKSKEINLLRFAFLIYFIPNAFLFAKWTRFMAPVFPVTLIFSLVFLFKLRISNIIRAIFILAMILPGLAYLSIYQNPDVRFTASDWIYKNIPANSYILSETANVVDIPVQNKIQNINNHNYKVVSFNFYDLDENPQLQDELKMHLQRAEYIFVPSRRLFKNHPKEKYPILWDYYEKLFSGNLGFQKVTEFSSYPEIKFQISNFKFQIKLSDENAEETWSVFDHPVVRIYKRI